MVLVTKPLLNLKRKPKMTISINDLDIPNIKHTFTEKVYTEKIREISKGSWIVRNVFCFTLLNHEDCSNVLRDSRWHSAMGIFAELNPNFPPEFKEKRKKGLLAIDGLDHNRLKKLLTPAFSSVNLEKIRPFIKKVINDFIDEFIEKGEVDLQKDIFNFYPIPVLCKAFGIPDENWVLFSGWADTMFKLFNLDNEITLEKIVQAQNEFNEYTENLIENRRKNLGDDLLSKLIIEEQNGDKLTNEELIMLIEILVASGIDTTRMQLGLSINTILKDKECLENIVKDIDNINTYIEDSIRIESVIRGTFRIASEDIIYKDILFPKGTLVFLNVITAHQDDRVFEDSESITTNRSNIQKSLSFGAGVHYCVGHFLARMSLQEVFTAIITRMKNIEINGQAIRLPGTSLINGYESIPVKFTPEERL
jgi:cytochrome P450